MDQAYLSDLSSRLYKLRQEGLYKAERIIDTPQQAVIGVVDGHPHEVINLCANNYLGLANHPLVIERAHRALDEFGYGMASVRFICGTQVLHKQLEARIAEFLGTEDTILYSSCFDANGGLFEALLTEQDAVISDALNHASVIDGIRLSKARRFVYRHNDMDDLETQLKQAGRARTRIIATDGVFSMDGTIADLVNICDLAGRYDSLVMVDDSHATGFLGPTGRGSMEYRGVSDRIDIITSTLGKALGGASGGFTSAHRSIVDWLRQTSRPYLFSNSLAPTIAATSVAVLDLLRDQPTLRDQLRNNSAYFRKGLEELGFELLPGEHPIIPVMLGDARLAVDMADRLLQQGVYVVGFSYPVVPRGAARIRTQMSAAHTRAQLDQALEAFRGTGRSLGVVP